MMRLEDLLARLHLRSKGNPNGVKQADLKAQGYREAKMGRVSYFVRRQGDDLTIYIKEGRRYRLFEEYVRKSE